MYYPISLNIKNLFSHEESNFDFINNQTTAIVGVNKTDSGMLSNGSGKTSILDCVSISLLGEPLRDISKKEIVRNGESSGECTLVLRNTILNKEIKIISEVNSTKSSKVLIWENGELNTKLKDLEAKASYKYILELIGISKEDLRNYFLISKDSYQSFFDNGDTAKKEIINRFSKANMIDAVDPLIKDDIILLDATIKELQDQYISNVGALNHINEEINEEKLESSIENTRKLTIEALQLRHDTAKKLCDELPDKIEEKEAEIKKQYKIVSDIEKLIETVNKSITLKSDKKEEINKNISNIVAKEWDIEDSFKPKLDKLKEFQDKYEQEIKKHKADIKECDKTIEDLNKQLAGEIDCPKCKHKFILADKEFNIEEAFNTKDELEILKVDINKSIKDIETKIDKLHLKKLEYKKEIDGFKKSLEEEKLILKSSIDKIDIELKEFKQGIKEQEFILSKENGTIRSLNNELGQLDGKANYYIEEIDSCIAAIVIEKNKKYPDKIAELQEKIDTLTEQNETLQKEIDGWNEDKGILLEWQVRFKQFKSFLANSSISAIEQMTNYFLSKMNTNLTVQIEGYRELSNKKLKEEITTLVTRDGLNGESFTKFSGGEKAIIDIACILAMQKIINIATEGGGLNLLFIDEILESADSKALYGVVKALTQLDQTIFLITHVEQNMFDCNKLQVEKVNGVSKIVSLSEIKNNMKNKPDNNELFKVEEIGVLQKSNLHDIKQNSDENELIKPKKVIKKKATK